MKIYINQIPLEGVVLEEKLNTKDLDLEIPNIYFSEPINIRAEAYRITNTVTVSLKLKSKIRAICSRCLEEFSVDLDRKLSLSYPIQKTQDCIEPDEDIREEIILDYPLKPLCKSDCKGLCIQCGKNLNQGLCNCVRD